MSSRRRTGEPPRYERAGDCSESFVEMSHVSGGLITVAGLLLGQPKVLLMGLAIIGATCVVDYAKTNPSPEE